MHYQVLPHEEAKLIRSTQGSIYDLVLDLRRQSSTFMDWVAGELSSESRNMVYVPRGCAHGFLTLEDESEVGYQASLAREGRGLQLILCELWRKNWLPSANQDSYSSNIGTMSTYLYFS